MDREQLIKGFPDHFECPVKVPRLRVAQYLQLVWCGEEEMAPALDLDVGLQEVLRDELGGQLEQRKTAIYRTILSIRNRANRISIDCLHYCKF